MKSWKVWRFERYGEPEVMQLGKVPEMPPAPGEVLVKVQASGVNPSDVKNVSGHFGSSTPRVPGRDFAGVIVAGEGREGEEVWGSAPGFGVTRDGTHQEYVALPSAWVTRKPGRLRMEEAAAVGVPWLAAWSSLITVGELQSGETILVTGASGAVGRAATEIAHRLKARVVGADISPANPSGADAMIDTTHQDLAAEVMALSDGLGVDLVLDAVGGPLFAPALKSLRKGGRQVVITSNPQVVSFNLVEFYHNRARLLGVDTMALSGPEITAILNRLADGFEDGSYAPPTVQTWPFERAVDAYNAVRNSQRPVKHVLVMG